MASYNKLTIVGNVGRDPEMKYLSTGAALCTFSVAVSQHRGQEETTEWFKVTTWRKLAETCNQYVRKGMQVLVTGELVIERYTTKEGEARVSAAITANDVLFLSRVDSAENDIPAPSTDVPF